MLRTKGLVNYEIKGKESYTTFIPFKHDKKYEFLVFGGQVMSGLGKKLPFVGVDNDGAISELFLESPKEELWDKSVVCGCRPTSGVPPYPQLPAYTVQKSGTFQGRTTKEIKIPDNFRPFRSMPADINADGSKCIPEP